MINQSKYEFIQYLLKCDDIEKEMRDIIVIIEENKKIPALRHEMNIVHKEFLDKYDPLCEKLKILEKKLKDKYTT